MLLWLMNLGFAGGRGLIAGPYRVAILWAHQAGASPEDRLRGGRPLLARHQAGAARLHVYQAGAAQASAGSLHRLPEESP